MSFKDYCKKAKIDTSKMKEIKGLYDEIKDWKMDPKGYFLIKVNKEKNRIELGFCPETNKITFLITGNTPQDIYFKVCEMGLVSRLDHAAYLGKELQKAFIALKNNLSYEQDEDINIK